MCRRDVRENIDDDNNDNINVDNVVSDNKCSQMGSIVFLWSIHLLQPARLTNLLI